MSLARITWTQWKCANALNSLVNRRFYCLPSVVVFQSRRKFCDSLPMPKKATVNVTYVTRDGDRFTVQSKEGENLLDIAINNSVDLEGFGQCSLGMVDMVVQDDMLDDELPYAWNQFRFYVVANLCACGGTLACSTCHLIFRQEDYDKIPNKPTDEELDMLDLAFGLCETSRLGCQICVTKELDGIEVTVPEGVSDARNK